MARSTLPARTTTPPLNPRFIRNLRDLGNWVHIDYLYQHFLNAALILLNETVPPASLEGDPRRWPASRGTLATRMPRGAPIT
jgi:hypothetical protein